MVQLLQICAVQSPGPELHLIKKVYFSKSLSHIGGKPLALCLRLAAGFMLGPSFWVFLPKLLHQPVVKISILCRVILMDPTRPPVVCHLTVECSTFEVEVEAGGRVSAQSRTIPITQRCPNYSRHFAPALPVQSSNVKCRNRQNFQKTSPTLALAIPHISSIPKSWYVPLPPLLAEEYFFQCHRERERAQSKVYPERTFIKHRKNCECCHHHSLFRGHNVNVKIVVPNCQKCYQCLKCQVSGHKYRGLPFEGVL